MLLLRCLLLCLVSTAALVCGAVGEPRPYVVVLDAGHGGNDLGCTGKSLKEKTVTLDVARRTGEMLRKALGDSVKVVYTRDKDVFVPLAGRASIANESAADIFVSIHVNSVDRRTRGRQNIHGASVYTVGLHKSEANLAVAMRENSVISLEEDSTEAYQGFDPNSSESYIIFELSQNSNMEQSIELASAIQSQLISCAGRADKGVRQAGFLVLWATRMPSVLVELDFMCNPEAESFLASADGRRRCAQAITNALLEYRRTSSAAKNVNINP